MYTSYRDERNAAGWPEYPGEPSFVSSKPTRGLLFVLLIKAEWFLDRGINVYVVLDIPLRAIRSQCPVNLICLSFINRHYSG